MSLVASSAAAWTAPVIDYHALAPEIVLAVGLSVVLLVDLFTAERNKWLLSVLTGFTLLGATLPVLTLAIHDDSVRSLFEGRYVVDEFSLVMKGL
ncbi:MAG: NADH-quinone oxidoreductase subunit N, partial [Ilumatobacteraceae bacterium]